MNKTVWILWLQGIEQAPEIVLKCYESWVYHNSDWTVRVLSEDDIEELVPEVKDIIGKNSDVIIRPHIADLVRVNLLKKFGGVWADATLFCLRPLDDWLIPALDENGFYMFKNPHNDKVSDNWFIAAPKGSRNMQYLAETINSYWENAKFYSTKFKFLNKVITKLVVLSLSKRNPWLSQFVVHPFFHRTLKVYPYFWFHFSFNRMYYTDPGFRMFWDNNRALPASPCLNANHTGLKAKIDENKQMKKLIDEKATPVLKLHKNIVLRKAADTSVIHYILKTLRYE